MRNLVTQFIRYLTNSVIGHLPSHHLRRAWYVGVVGMSIGRRTSLLMGLHVQVRGRPRADRPGIVIGNHSVINAGCHLDGRGGLVIGDNVSVSPGVWIITDEHDINDPLFPEVLAPVRIEDHAFIGAKAMVLPGVTIGRGAVVGAGAVVTRDVAPLQVVAGVPARPISERQPELRYRLDYQPAFE
jgi:maltose O-acetyltransferase